MKRTLLVLLSAGVLLACNSATDSSPSKQTDPADNQSDSAQPSPQNTAEANAFNAGVFVTMAEDHLKSEEGEYMNVYRQSQPLASTVNQPVPPAELTSWTFEMSANKAGRGLEITLATCDSESEAEALFKQVPSFSYLRSNLATNKQHRTGRFGRQCVHLAAGCEISKEQFQAVWEELTNALDNPVFLNTHDQPCAEAGV